jgi:hypothetical protein
MASLDPRLPAPYPPGITVEEELEKDVVWEAEFHAFVKNLVICKLSPEATAAQFFALFAAPDSTRGPTEAAEQEDAVWEAELHAFVKNIVTSKLSPETTAAQLFALFDAPEHEPDHFYDVCLS